MRALMQLSCFKGVKRYRTRRGIILISWVADDPWSEHWDSDCGKYMEHEMGMLLVLHSIRFYISHNYPSSISLITNVLQDNKPPVPAHLESIIREY